MAAAGQVALGDLGDRRGAEQRLRLAQGRNVAGDEKLEFAGRETGRQPLHGAHDDLRADAGGVAHGDGEMVS